MNDGTDESVAVNTLTVDVTAVNDPATGKPEIAGTAQVGQTLTATMGTIADVEGLGTFTYQWIRVSSGIDNIISGATASTYTLLPADEGKTIKVRFSFTDGENNAETRTSDAYPSGGTVLPANTAPTSADKTVTATEDTDYTFSSAAFPFTDTDGDSLSSVKIVTLPATGKGTLKLNTTPVTANQSVTAANLGTLKYSPPANAHGTSFASFTFKVNDGTDDSVAVNTLTVDVTAVNDPATGKPEIGGTAQVGQTLTATMGTIADVEGLGTFTYQWIQVSSGTDNIISGATASTYTLLPADEGKTIKVRFSFTDGENNAETRTSDTYPSVGAVLPANTAPTSADKTVTATEDTDYTFSSADFPFTDTDGDTLSSVKIVTLPASGTLKLNTTPVTANQSVTAANLGTLKYSPPANAHGTDFASFTFKVNDGTDDSVAVNTLTIDVTAVNDPATGKPEIGGTAQVGQTLTATMGTIADVEGLGTFTYQWIRVSSGTDNIISGATASTYTLLPADEGKTIKVRFSFTDGENNAETRTSDAYPSVGAVLPANNPPTSADKTVTATEDTDYTFSSADFVFTDTDGDSLSSVKIVTLPASGTLKLITTPVTANQSVPAANLGTLKYSPPANAHGTGFASFTFKVNDGTDDSVAVNTLTIDVTAVNDPATGKPGIAGTARVGQTLTATTGTIADVDGLPDPFFSHASTTVQWIRVDSDGSSNPTDISGATASTYLLVDDDLGKTIKVKVSFDDRDGNDEGPLTSAAYPTSGTVLAAATETTPPMLVSTDPAVLAADGKTLTLTYNEALNTSAVPANSGLHGQGDAPWRHRGAAGAGLDGRGGRVGLDGGADAGRADRRRPHRGQGELHQAGRRPGDRGRRGNDAALSFTDQAVTNNSLVPRVTIEAVYAEATPGIAEPEFTLTRSNTEGGDLEVILNFTQDQAYLSR